MKFKAGESDRTCLDGQKIFKSGKNFLIVNLLIQSVKFNTIVQIYVLSQISVI